MVESTEIEKQKAATIRTLWGVQTVAFCFNGSSSFPLSLSLFPALLPVDIQIVSTVRLAISSSSFSFLI